MKHESCVSIRECTAVAGPARAAGRGSASVMFEASETLINLFLDRSVVECHYSFLNVPQISLVRRQIRRVGFLVPMEALYAHVLD